LVFEAAAHITKAELDRYIYIYNISENDTISVKLAPGTRVSKKQERKTMHCDKHDQITRD
jgi:hypothetical protein